MNYRLNYVGEKYYYVVGKEGIKKIKNKYEYSSIFEPYHKIVHCNTILFLKNCIDKSRSI